MRASPFHPGPLEDLTVIEIEALCAVKQGRNITAGISHRLELLALIKESLHGWALTPEGDWRLQAGK
jgi:hypothetical protein